MHFPAKIERKPERGLVYISVQLIENLSRTFFELDKQKFITNTWHFHFGMTTQSTWLKNILWWCKSAEAKTYTKATYCCITVYYKCNFCYRRRSSSESKKSTPEWLTQIRQSICNISENNSDCLFKNIFTPTLHETIPGRLRNELNKTKIVVKYRCMPSQLYVNWKTGELWWCNINDIFVNRKILYKIQQSGCTNNKSYKIYLVFYCFIGTKRCKVILAHFYLPDALSRRLQRYLAVLDKARPIYLVAKYCNYENYKQ